MKYNKLIIIGLIAVLATACTGKATPVDKLSEPDKQYYKGLSEFKIQDRGVYEQYIRNYVEYTNRDIPDDIFNELEKLTDQSIIDTQLAPNFLNKQQDIIDPDLEEIEGDTGGFDDTQSEDEIKVEEETAQTLDRIIEIVYLYKEHTYAVKVSPVNGKTYILYFKIRDGKVVDIYV